MQAFQQAFSFGQLTPFEIASCFSHSKQHLYTGLSVSGIFQMIQTFKYAFPLPKNCFAFGFSWAIFMFIFHVPTTITFPRNLIHFIFLYCLLFLCYFSSIPIMPFRELITCYNFSLVTFYVLLSTNIAINRIITCVYLGDNRDLTWNLKELGDLGTMISMLEMLKRENEWGWETRSGKQQQVVIQHRSQARQLEFLILSSTAFIPNSKQCMPSR